MARRLGVDAILVRLGFVVLASAGGFGVALYLVLWALSVPEPDRDRSAPPLAAGARAIVALGAILAGTLLLLREVGVWFGDPVVVSVALGAAGSGVIWARRPETGGREKLRLAGGLPLIVAGVVVLLQTSEALAAVKAVTFAILVTVAALGLLFGPWIWRLGRQLAAERRERIRSQERAEVAAHLHDSVLQTLALIQRNRDPARMASLARTQERELRAWLYGAGRLTVQPEESLRAALEDAAARVEDQLLVPVEVVMVGDCRLDAGLRALVEAAGEAIHNAAKHSGASSVSVYGEVQEALVRVYVRDEGRGFDLAAVPPDRKGIAESIRRRLHRNGGAVAIVTAQDEGTEVRLRMALSGGSR